jgi:hypothetical protein
MSRWGIEKLLDSQMTTASETERKAEKESEVVFKYVCRVCANIE